MELVITELILFRNRNITKKISLEPAVRKKRQAQNGTGEGGGNLALSDKKIHCLFICAVLVSFLMSRVVLGLSPLIYLISLIVPFESLCPRPFELPDKYCIKSSG